MTGAEDLVFTYEPDDSGEAVRDAVDAFAKDGGYLLVAKYSTRMTIPYEMYEVRPLNPYQLAVDRELNRQLAAQREQDLAAFWSDLLDTADRLPAFAGDMMRAVLELHAPDTEARSWLTCPVCDADDIDPGNWPCRTVTAIAAAYGIEVPQ